VAERLLLDTDVLVEYLRGRVEAVGYLEGLVSDVYVSVISVAELFAGVIGEEERSLRPFLVAFDARPSPRRWRGRATFTGGTTGRATARALRML